MDHIRGTLRIISDLEYFYKDIAFYSPYGINKNCTEIAANIDGTLKDLKEFKINLVLHSYFELTFNTYQNARGLYEAIIYPVEYGELKHVFCLGALENIDLKDTYDMATVNINGRLYYLYATKTTRKDNNLTYRFVTED